MAEQQQQKDMAGVIFANKNKTTEKHPDGTGKCMIDGVMYYMDSWNNTSANGVVYRSIKFKRMEKQDAPKVETFKGGLRQSISTPSNFDPSDIPF